jgi:hypothetical protein
MGFRGSRVQIPPSRFAYIKRRHSLRAVGVFAYRFSRYDVCYDRDRLWHFLRPAAMPRWDGRGADDAPHGRIRRRGEVDKEQVDMWVTLSESTRAAIDRIFERNPVLGDLYLFPAGRRGTSTDPRHGADSTLATFWRERRSSQGSGRSTVVISTRIGERGRRRGRTYLPKISRRQGDGGIFARSSAAPKKQTLKRFFAL